MQVPLGIRILLTGLVQRGHPGPISFSALRSEEDSVERARSFSTLCLQFCLPHCQNKTLLAALVWGEHALTYTWAKKNVYPGNDLQPSPQMRRIPNITNNSNKGVASPHPRLYQDHFHHPQRKPVLHSFFKTLLPSPTRRTAPTPSSSRSEVPATTPLNLKNLHYCWTSAPQNAQSDISEGPRRFPRCFEAHISILAE